MDANQTTPDAPMEEPTVTPDVAAVDDVIEDATAIAVHPLVMAVRQLEILQSQVFLAGPPTSIQAQSRDQGQLPTGEDPGPYCRLACDVLSCAVSACELWRDSLLRHHVPSATHPYPELSTAELIRLLSKLLASLHVLDCLKDSKQVLRTALTSVTAQEGDEQQLLAAVQDFFNMPSACLILLRDMLLEDPSLLTRTKQALLRLLPIQLEAADCGQGSGQEGERKRGTLKSKLGFAGLGSQAAGEGSGGAVDGSVCTRSTARIALSLLVYLYCCVDTAEQEHIAIIQPADGAPGITPTGAKAAAAGTHKLLRACMACLRTMPIVHGYGDVPVDLLRPLQGLQQLTSGAPWESVAGTTVHQIAVASEDRYSLAPVSAAAAHDFGRIVEELLALKLQHDAETQRLAEEARPSAAGGEAKAGPSEAAAPSRPASQVALSRAAGALASRAMQLLQDWQAAVLQLDAFRTWQRRQRQEEAAGEEGEQGDATATKPALPRCAFTSSDMPDVVRMVSYIKGLHGVVLDNMTWLEPLLRLHCAAHLGQLVSAVVTPVAQGVLGAAATAAAAKTIAAGVSHQEHPSLAQIMAQMSMEDQPASAPSSARGTGAGSVFASTNVASASNGPGHASLDAEAAAAAGLALGMGRIWKGKATKHGRSHSTASSLDVAPSELRQAPPLAPLAPPLGASIAPAPPVPPPPPMPPAPAGPLAAVLQAEATANGPSQRTTEDSADTANLISSITADGLSDWTTGRAIDFRNDPYARLREWFAQGSAVNGASAGGQAAVAPPLQPVPEVNSPRSERSPAAATVASFGRRGGAGTPSVEIASLAAANSPSIGQLRGSVGSSMAWAGNASGARLPANTVTDGTEDGVECTVSSVSDDLGDLNDLESEDEAVKPAAGQPGVVAIVESPIKDPASAAKEAQEKPRSHPSPSPSSKASQLLRQSPPPHWPAADLLWPPPPIPSASWLTSHAISPGNTVSAGGAASGTTTRSPGAGLPRMTAPAALSTNPLYIYPSAAREAVAEQERATVAIWMASEGGAGTPHAITPEQAAAAAAAVAAGGSASARGPFHEAATADPSSPAHPRQDSQQRLGGVRIFCDDTASNAATDSMVQHPHSFYGEDRPSIADTADILGAGGLHSQRGDSCAIMPRLRDSQQHQHEYADSIAHPGAGGYTEEILVSHTQMDQPGLSPPQVAYASHDDLDQVHQHQHHHVHFEAGNTTAPPAPPPQAPPPPSKKIVSSPFKRIKKLFSKRGGAGASTDKSLAASSVAASIHAASFDDPTAAFTDAPYPLLEALYNGDFPAAVAGFGALPPPYLVDPRDMTNSANQTKDVSNTMETESNYGVQATSGSYSAYGLGRNNNNNYMGLGVGVGMSGDFLPALMAEATSRDGAVAVLSVGPSAQQIQMEQSMMQLQMGAGEVLEVQQAAGAVAAGGKGGLPAGGKRMVSGGGMGALKGGSGTAAFFDIAMRARDEYSVQRLRHFANDMQVCLATAGIVMDDAPKPSSGGLASIPTSSRVARKAFGSSSSGARASLKRLVTTIKGKAGGRHRASGDTGASLDQDVQLLACDALQQGSGLDAQAAARLRNVAELMVQEMEAMIAHRRARGKSKEGPSLMQLLALTAELRAFLNSSLPSLEPLLDFRASLDAAADLSPLMVLDPSRTYGALPGNGLGSDARGSVPWELAHKGVLVSGSAPSGVGAEGSVAEMPLTAGLTVLALFKDAIEAIQLQQAQAAATGYPEAPTAARLQQLYRRQAKWCLNTFVQMAARKVWGTYKAHSVRSRLGLTIPQGAPDVAASAASFQGLFRPLREDSGQQQLLALANTRPEAGLENELTITDQLAGAIDDLVRQSAARLAELLLGSDLMVLVAVKQQVDVLSLAVSRLRRELPTLRPWNDAWLAALSARAASAPTCASIAEAAAATAAAVTQGCGSHASGLLTVEEIILTHVCSVASLRTLSTWSYDMTSVRFKPTKHTKAIWEGLVGSTANTEAAPPPLLFPDGADIALAAAANGSSPAAAAGGSGNTGTAAAGRCTDGSTGWFGRAHVQALHGILGLDGTARWAAALRRHAVELLADAAPLLRRVHELYDSSLAGPRGPGMRDSGGASGFLQLQQRWLRDRGHSELLVSAHRAMQALGNTVATVALTDSVLAELCVGRAPHMLPLAASSIQADQQAHAALKAVAAAEPAANPASSLVKAAPLVVPPPPRGAGLAGLLLGQQLPPGLMNATQSAVQAAALVQDRLQEQLPAAFGLPGLWRALHECLHPGQPAPTGQQLLSSTRLWCVVQLQLSCLSPEEQVVHSANVGDGVYVAAAALVQLAAGASIAPGSVLNGDTMTQLQQAVSLEQLKADLAAVTNPQGPQGPAATLAIEKGTFEQLKAWSSRADAVKAAWDRAVQLTVGAGTAAAKRASGAPRSARAETSPMRGLDMPALTPCASEPWAALAQQAAAAGTAMLIRAAAAAAAPPPQVLAPQAPALAQSQGAPGSRMQNALPQGRASSQPGSTSLNQTMPNPARTGPPRPPASQQHSLVSANGVTGVQRMSLNGPPLPPRMGPNISGSQSLPRSLATDGPLLQHPQLQQPQPQLLQPQHQQQGLQQLRAASHVLMRSPRGEAGGLFTVAGSTAAQSRSRPASSLGDWGHME